MNLTFKFGQCKDCDFPLTEERICMNMKCPDSPHYVSPEQLDKVVNTAMDWWTEQSKSNDI